jgi:hypothetical protein
MLYREDSKRVKAFQVVWGRNHVCFTVIITHGRLPGTGIEIQPGLYGIHGARADNDDHPSGSILQPIPYMK